MVYSIEKWGRGYFEVLKNGELGLKNPLIPEHSALSIYQIIKDLEGRGIQTPVLLRVREHLYHGIYSLNKAFANAIKANGYNGKYLGVFPIKVNQQAHVVEELVNFGGQFDYGIEAGSKPELVIALSQKLTKEALIICNGVKDEEFIELAMISNRVGFNTFIVIESPKEVETIISVHKRTGLKPRLGVRIKLTHRIGGKWQESSGDRSTFGLNTAQLIKIIERLREEGLLDCLVLQHSHLGSQIPDIIDVRYAVNEACRYYRELRAEGVPLAFLDIGGGLGVDYTGEKSALENSINYTVEEYCTNVVESTKMALDAGGVPHPTIITESGRAVVAKSSLLVTNVLEVTQYDAPEAPLVGDDEHHHLRELRDVERYLENGRLQECFNDALYYRDEMRALFRRGNISIREMAKGEEIYLYLISKIKSATNAETGEHLLRQLENSVDIYHCNFSLFQSLPDHWAIEQLHPVAPLQRLNEVASRRAVLADITCDSDGKIDKFILDDGIHHSLPVHPVGDDPYYLGVFFVGAYQETLGDLHNLFGDTNIAMISLKENGFDLVYELGGDTIAEVLSYVEYDPKESENNFRKVLDKAVSESRIEGDERRAFTKFYRECMNGYTYYE